MAKDKNANGAEQAQENDLLKVVGDEVMNAVNAASGDLKGDSFETVEAALEAAGGEDPFFNPTLSQYREGLCINTHREVAKIKKVPVGSSSRKAWVITCPAGYKKDGKVVYSQAFNFYPSTLRKQIQVTDEFGDPVLDENMTPVVRPAKTTNSVWNEARGLTKPEDLLEFALDKVFETSEIIRDFGPSVFVKQKDDSNKATSHKLTSVPMFNVIG